jgi:hypothetical protein
MTDTLADICFNSERQEVTVEQLQNLLDSGAEFTKAEKNGWSALYLLCRYDPKLNVDKLQVFRKGGVVNFSQVAGPDNEDMKEMPEKIEFDHLIRIWAFIKG